MILIVVVTDQSLLVQGIISFLHRSVSSVNIQVVEVRQPSDINKIISLRPDVVILDSNGLSNSSLCPLNILFAKLSRLVVVEVNQETSNVQIIQSSQYAASGVNDLLNVLMDTNGSLVPGLRSINLRVD
jgi:DNA-binding NarL/FixJ family response regulator